MLSWIKQHKRIITYGILIIGLLYSVFFWHPHDAWRVVLRRIIIGNIVFVCLVSLLLQTYFTSRYRTIQHLLDIFSNIYDEQLTYRTAPVVLIKQHLRDHTQPSFLLDTTQDPQTARSTLILLHEGQRYDFVHRASDKYVEDLASVLIYYLKQDIPYELLYEETKHIHHHLHSVKKT